MLPPPGPWGCQWSSPPGWHEYLQAWSQQQMAAAREGGPTNEPGPAVRRVFAGPREADGGTRSRSPARSAERRSRRRSRSRRPSPTRSRGSRRRGESPAHPEPGDRSPAPPRLALADEPEAGN
eukprot:1272506-Alexandrium_andersonii.AAC.1